MIENDDSRNFNRVKDDFDIRITIGVDNIDISSKRVGKSVDISASGVLFSYAKPIEKGSEISVAFIMPNSFDFFRCSARVARVKLNKDSGIYNIAAEFINLNNDERKKLDYYINR